MKFTKEQAFEKLKGDLTKGGKTSRLTDRTINVMLETLIPLMANEETELDDFFNNASPAFIAANGNMEKDYSEFVRTHQSQTTTSGTTQTPPQTVTTPVESESVLAQMQAQLEEMKQKWEAEQKEKLVSARRKDFRSEIKKLGVKDDKWIEKYTSEISISEDLDVSEKAKVALELYNLSQAQTPIGLTPSSNGGVTDGKVDWSDVKNCK